MVGRTIPNVGEEEGLAGRRIPAAGSGRGSFSRQGAAAGGEERSGVVRSYEITPTPIPFLNPWKRRGRSLRPKHTGVSGVPEFPWLRAEILHRPESPALDTGVSGPHNSEELVLWWWTCMWQEEQVLGHGEAWDRQHNLGWYFTLNLQKPKTIKAKIE